MNKRTLQEIFDAVIDAKLYPFNETKFRESSNYMCTALRSALALGIISKEEWRRASKSINTYIDTISWNVCGSMSIIYSWGKLGIIKDYSPHYPMTEENKQKLLKCFKDWTNRPYAHRKLKSLQKKEV